MHQSVNSTTPKKKQEKERHFGMCTSRDQVSELSTTLQQIYPATRTGPVWLVDFSSFSSFFPP